LHIQNGIDYCRNEYGQRRNEFEKEQLFMRQAIAVIMIILLVFPLIFATMTSFSVSTWALDRGFYLQLVSDERIYEAILRDASWQEEQIFEVTEFEGIPSDALTKALREVVTPNYLRSQAVALVDETFDAIQGRAATLELSVDITPLKDRLRSDGGDRFARSLAANLPLCSSGQKPLAAGAQMPRCRPTDLSEEQTAQLITAALPGFLDNLPDTYPEPPEKVFFDYGPETEFWTSFIGTNRLIWASVLLALVAASFWVGAAFVGGENRRQIVQWLGWPLFVPAVLTLICGISIRIAAGWPWIDYGLGNWMATDVWYRAEVAGVVSTVVRTAIKAVARGFLITGGISIGISLSLIIWSFSISTEEE
jgi:ABC-type maltose transport system permease subunit